LNIDRSDKQDFGATSKANISTGGDNVAGSNTSRILGYIGYAIPGTEMRNGNRFEVVPYIGLNRNVVTVNTGSTAKPSHSDTADFGVLISKYVVSINDRGSVFGHAISLRPDYLADYVDGSRLFTLNLEYMPVINGLINTFIRMNHDQEIASIKPIFSVKNDNGAYVNHGSAAAASSNKNFIRVGVQLGFVIASDVPAIPFDFTSSYTGLSAITGKTRISYFKNSLNYSFDQDKYFGISLSNSHGVREDTARNENLWNICVTARF
jgi:hypothetical protein